MSNHLTSAEREWPWPRASDSYVAIMSHHIGKEWELVSHVCRHGQFMRQVVTSHSYWNDFLKGKGIESAMVTDNTPDMTTALQLASMLHVALQLALNLPSVAHLLRRVRILIKFCSWTNIWRQSLPPIVSLESLFSLHFRNVQKLPL